MEKAIDRTIDKILDVFFSKDRTKLYLLLIFLLGLILRVINVMNMPVSVDAAGHAVMAVNFVSSGRIATWNQSVGLWHFLTDLSYRIFGITDFSSRLVALILGSFSIILMFFFVKEFFGKNVGLIAALLLALSPFHILETLPEMDVSTMFFVLFSMFFYVRALKLGSKRLFIYSALLIGVAFLIKIYSLLFIPAFWLYALYFCKRHKKSGKNVILFTIIAFIFLIIPVAYNYLLYEDKGFVDYIATGITGIGKEKSDQYYSWAAQYRHEYLEFFIGGSKLVDTKLPIVVWGLTTHLRADILVLVMGILGLILIIIKNEKDYLYLFLAVMAFVYVYLGSISGLMSKHFIFLLIMFIPLASFSLEKISRKFNVKILVILIVVFQLFWIYHYTDGGFIQKSGLNQIVSYKENMNKDSLVIYDSRIFRGIGVYLFADKHYLESLYFPEIINSQEKMPGDYENMEVYFVECVTDDCGWGTIKDQPDFNESMEDIVEFFKNNSELTNKIRSNEKKSFSFNVYKTTLRLKRYSLTAADSTHVFWMNPLGYDERIASSFDKYDAITLFGNLVDKIAHIVLYSAVGLAIVSILYLAYLFINWSESSENLK